jgi:hypothetical protein
MPRPFSRSLGQLGIILEPAQDGEEERPAPLIRARIKLVLETRQRLKPVEVRSQLSTYDGARGSGPSPLEPASIGDDRVKPVEDATRQHEIRYTIWIESVN